MKNQVYILIICLIFLPQTEIFPQKPNMLNQEYLPFPEEFNASHTARLQISTANPDAYRNRETLGEEWDGAASSNSYRWTYSYDEIPVSAIPEVTDDFLFLENYPNPFNPSTKIIFVFPNATRISLRIYDIQGREIITLSDEERPAGKFETVFRTGNLMTGIYYCRLTAGQSFAVRKLIIIR